MAKFFGSIGYVLTVETEPGIFEEQEVVHQYYGDMYKLTKRYESSNEKLNDNIRISNELSIVADPFAVENFIYMRYVEFMGQKWKIESVDASQYPRLVLTVGGLYNGTE